jgi:hypothetical protein
MTHKHTGEQLAMPTDPDAGWILEAIKQAQAYDSDQSIWLNTHLNGQWQACILHWKGKDQWIGGLEEVLMNALLFYYAP